jgi:tetratricopeptide (TPR) repeat protein
MLALVLTASLFSTIQKSMPCAAVLIPPSISQAPWIKAVALFQMDDRTVALRELDRLVKNKPGDCFLLTLRGLVREKDGNHAGAVDDFALILKVNASNDWAQERRDRYLRLLAAGESNLKSLLAAVRLAPGKFLCTFCYDAEACGKPGRQILLHLLDRHLQNNRSDMAALCLRGLLRHAEGRLTEAIEDYSTYLWNEPRDVDVYGFQAMAEHAVGNSAGALISARHLVELNPHYGWGQGTLAVLLVEADRLNEAREAVDKAIAVNYDPCYGYWLRGQIRARLGDRAGAIEDFSRLGEMGSYWAGYGSDGSLIKASDGDLEGALADAQKAVKRYPSSKTFYSRAIVHCIRGEMGKSIADITLSWRTAEKDKHSSSNKPPTCFTLGLSTRPERSLSNKQQAQFYLNEGIALVLAGDRNEAAVCFNYVLYLQKSWASGYAARGLFHATGGEYSLAMADLRLMLRPPVLNDYANSFSSTGNDESAKKDNDEQNKKTALVDRLSYQYLDELLAADSDPKKPELRSYPFVGSNSAKKEPQAAPK